MTEKMFALIDGVDAGRYGATAGEMIAINKRAGEDKFDLMHTAFKFGFLKGQRAEKAKMKKGKAK